MRVICLVGGRRLSFLLRHCDGYAGYMYLGVVTSHSCALMRDWLRLRSTPGSSHEWLCMPVGACVRIFVYCCLYVVLLCVLSIEMIVCVSACAPYFMLVSRSL